MADAEHDPKVRVMLNLSIPGAAGVDISDTVTFDRDEWNRLSLANRQRLVDDAHQTFVANEVNSGFTFVDPADNPWGLG